MLHDLTRDAYRAAICRARNEGREARARELERKLRQLQERWEMENSDAA